MFAVEAPLTTYKLLLSLVLKFLFNTCLIKTFGFQSSCFWYMLNGNYGVCLQLQDEDLYAVFGTNLDPEMGVEAIRVPRDPQTSIGKGFGFVLFKSKVSYILYGPWMLFKSMRTCASQDPKLYWTLIPKSRTLRFKSCLNVSAFFNLFFTCGSWLDITLNYCTSTLGYAGRGKCSSCQERVESERKEAKSCPHGHSATSATTKSSCHFECSRPC